MDRELAHLVAVQAFRASSLLGEMVPLLKAKLPSAEYMELSRRLNECNADIGLKVLDFVLAEHPSVRADLENRLKVFGRIF